MTKLIINGEAREAKDGKTYTVINPATEEVIAEVAKAGIEDTDDAINSAVEAFKTWKEVKPRERAELLRKLSTEIMARKEYIANIETENVGKPVSVSTDEIVSVANTFMYYSGAIDKFYGETIPTQGNGQLLTFKSPIGVVGLITPWNFPLGIASWKVAPALACGNTVVLNPASLTPLSAIELGKIALDVGFPKGVLNIVPGPGAIVGNRLAEHPKVNKISFTGSTSIGMNVMKKAAKTIKNVSLELGGKSPSIIFDDADIEKAAKSSVYGLFENTGQNCSARSRVLVQESIYDEFMDLLLKYTKELNVGNPKNEATDLGPLISESQLHTSMEYIRLGMEEGAELILGEDGTKRDNEKGYFLNPTILGNVKNDMRIAQEEIFGPVASIIKFKEEAEAVELANDIDYGLSGSVWTTDNSRAFRMINQINSGVLSINSDSSVHLEAPFGGVKQSGIGRELGMNALESYSETKTVFISYD